MIKGIFVALNLMSLIKLFSKFESKSINQILIKVNFCDDLPYIVFKTK